MNPNPMPIWPWFCPTAGMHEQALQAIDTAIESQMNPPLIYHGERGRILFFLGRYAEAQQELQRVQGLRAWLEFNIMNDAALGEVAQARLQAEQFLRHLPFVNQQYYRVSYAYYRRQQDLDLLVNSLGLAGIPRYAFGFEPGERVPLEQQGIVRLTDGTAWRGVNHDGGDFIQQFTKNQGVAPAQSLCHDVRHLRHRRRQTVRHLSLGIARFSGLWFYLCRCNTGLFTCLGHHRRGLSIYS